ncbi:PREDICTED: cyclin-dependent kinase 4-like [Acromyrmex echinatior]|uniref:cyclin-dependent kinase n=1 Tax=Acromyrmex echinatior TaxID=103372 RepID=F4X719_ACREC|nr:PREDICTED: cyclin-dependent kinase 4-like [Acromyrmex echinatior]XP_011066898.1 PREDICTED: cyclin-dependent kinase 4-like [Acromyrmex echinatior]XP_011066899.1 PREDICTED: cyclin-dependent kinase 4-like [Acromyrmex echinatior]XP_011066900.1 PREDICTED: cyclin-dependent kinase 4-like [Acromyrmex echinatior]XP_011066901.1 PREDICTED: cyclin-dependent kinase 4-like [Acromyrmex echinatior]EGI57781.1 Cell division protein kinase 6 [Acromyrmex echinatior]
MAGRSRRSSTELEPDLSTPTASKRPKQSDSSEEKHLTKVESTETSSTSEIPAQTEIISEGDKQLSDVTEISAQTEIVSEGDKQLSDVTEISAQTEIVSEGDKQLSDVTEISAQTEIVSEGDKQLSDVTEQATTSKQSVLISETSSESTKQSSQTDPDLPKQKSDIASTSTEAIPSTSREEQLKTLKSVVMKYSDQGELSAPSGRRSEETTIQSFSLRERASFENLSVIGNGAYGTVYKATDKNSGQTVALKRVRIPLTEDGLPTSTVREIAALKSLEQYEHPHIVRLLDICQGGDYLDVSSGDGTFERPEHDITFWLVFEHVERDLASYIANYRNSSPRSSIPPYLVRQMLKEILCGVEFLHSHRIIHRDLKPQNLLVTREGRIKIADFGLAKTYGFEMRLTSVVVTQWYRAPEVLLGCSYATPVDVWSVGCILAELCKLEPLFPGTSEGDQLDRIFQVLGTPSQEEWPENVSLNWNAFPNRLPRPLSLIVPDLNEDGLDLIKNMLMFDPHSRITAAQAVRHRYFSEEGVQ